MIDSSITQTACQQLLSDSALDSSEKQIPAKEVLAVLQHYYGLSGKLTRIPTEKDDTFRLITDQSGHAVLVKISSSYEDPALVDLQSQALIQVQLSDPTLRVPRLVRTLDGQTEVTYFEGLGPFPRVLRLLTYLPGKPLGDSKINREQRMYIGQNLARLSLALQGLQHSHQDRRLVWDLQNFPLLRPLLEYVDDPGLRRRIEEQFISFHNNIAPLLPEVRHQFLHDDLIKANTIMMGNEVGIIDFGDLVYTAIPLDLAVCLSSHMGDSGSSPWDGLGDIIGGYFTRRILSPAELEMALWAAPVRIALRALLICYQSKANPNRSEYLLSHSTGNKELLDALAATQSCRPKIDSFRK